MKVARFFALLFAALALTMTSAHVLELPAKAAYGPDPYAAVNGTLYRWFAVVGGAYTLASIVSAWMLVGLCRRRHSAFEWSLVGASLVSLAFVSWLLLVQPVNGAITHAVASAGFEGARSLWPALRGRWEYGHVTGFVLQLLGFSALAVSCVIESTERAPELGAVHTSTSRLIHASPERVAAIYGDYESWPRTFPRTVHGTRLIADEGPRKTVEVAHVEGRVLNVMSRVAPGEIVLDEWKKRYRARFRNRFEAVPGGTRFTVVADVVLEGALKALAPIARPIIRRRLRRFVLDPIRAVAEQRASFA